MVIGRSKCPEHSAKMILGISLKSMGTYLQRVGIVQIFRDKEGVVENFYLCPTFITLTTLLVIFSFYLKWFFS